MFDSVGIRTRDLPHQIREATSSDLWSSFNYSIVQKVDSYGVALLEDVDCLSHSATLVLFRMLIQGGEGVWEPAGTCEPYICVYWPRNRPSSQPLEDPRAANEFEESRFS